MAVRSSSHEAMTLPRRHTSAMSAMSGCMVVLGVTQRRSLGVHGLLLLARVGMVHDVQPSAYEAMMPYSMPLWTILTKWPRRLDRSVDSHVRLCRLPSPGRACGCRIDAWGQGRKNGVDTLHTSSSPPIIRQ